MSAAHQQQTTNKVRERRRRHQHGAFAETIVAAFLTLKGYRILARRWSSNVGEIDLIAVRGRYLVFVEVKQRGSIEAAESSITSRQRKRVHDAANIWLSRRPRYQNHEIRFDLVFVVSWQWPHHIEDGL